MKKLLKLVPLWQNIIDSKVALYSDIANDLSNIRVTVHNASWCPDCEREVTDLLALAAALKEQAPAIQIISYEDKARYKAQKAQGQLAIKCLPTIIFNDSHKEIGRIEEQAVTSFKTDLLAML